MLTIDLLKTLYGYNYWAHRLVWDRSISQLTESEFTQPLDYSWGSIHNQVVHTMSAEWMWFSRLGGTSPSAMLDPADYPTRSNVRDKWDDIESHVRSYLDTLTDGKLLGTFSYTTTSGNSYTQSVAEILMHVVNHGTDHRAQMLAMLHHLGASTVEQDLIFFLRERDTN
jgi:uncharacterized damage-inducible protein DinB